jgi:hypothetical protein
LQIRLAENFAENNQKRNNRMPEKYDVVIVTRGEWTLPYAIRAARRIIPINNLILVTTSNFLDEAKKLGNICIGFDESNVGKARAEGLKHVETSLYVSVDSDVQVTPQWFRWCSRTIQQPDVAACNGWERTMGKYDPIVKEKIIRKGGSRFCGLGNTFLKTYIIKKVGMPCIKADEDRILRDRIEALGYKWISNVDVVCHHIKNDVDMWKSYARFARLEKRIDKIERVALRIPYNLTFGIAKRPFMENLYIVSVELSLLYGKLLGAVDRIFHF